MRVNVGTIDAVLRILIGLALLSAVLVVPGPERWFGLVGLVPLLTATVRVCPLYLMLGINTCAADRQRD